MRKPGSGGGAGAGPEEVPKTGGSEGGEGQAVFRSFSSSIDGGEVEATDFISST